MSKFWGFAGLILLIGIITIITVNAQPGAHFTDLETKCVYENAPDPNIDFTQQNTVKFEGSYDFPNVKADLDYDYTQTNDRVTLNIKAENGDQPEDFERTCLGQVIYDAETDQLPEGRYLLRLQHNGETVEEMVVRTKR